MNNLFLGSTKRMLLMWKDKRYISDTCFDTLQERVDSINTSSKIGRIPSKISAAFAAFSTEQWMHWTILYSPVVLCDILPTEGYKIWCMFAKHVHFYADLTFMREM